MTQLKTESLLRSNLVLRLFAVFVLALLAAKVGLTFADRSRDQAITSKVKSAVHADPALRSLDIAVAAQDGVVTVSGVVTSQLIKERATERVIFLVHRVDGVRLVIDKLSVQVPS